MICEANDLEPVMLNLFRSAGIILCVPFMLPTIDLNDQLSLHAEEIDSIVQERYLPSKLEALEAPPTENLPQHIFR